MAGANDAARGFDPDKLRGLWGAICKEPSIVITLAPPSTNDGVSQRIDQINRIALADESGRIRPEFTIDGVHLGPKAYEQWCAKLVTLAEAERQQ